MTCRLKIGLAAVVGVVAGYLGAMVAVTSAMEDPPERWPMHDWVDCAGAFPREPVVFGRRWDEGPGEPERTG